MNYDQVIEYLYEKLPVFQNQGAIAFNKGLGKTKALLEHLGNPQMNFKSVHIGGTNGKGTTSHMLSSVFQSSGYKTGLYTSPHLKNFTERIRINGKEAEKAFIISFVEDNKQLIEEVKPSFFEVTVAMAFEYFSINNVEIAIIEVGMGGRLDSTNIILPELSIITSLSLDHQQYLGDTIEKIAFEKAGIIKKDTPVVLGECPFEAVEVFEDMAERMGSQVYETIDLDVSEYKTDLRGFYIDKNLKCVIKALELLSVDFGRITEESIKLGLTSVTELTGIKGRWQQLSENPLVICDTGHNEEAMEIIVEQLMSLPYDKLYFILGMVKDKIHESVLEKLPSEAYYYFVAPSIIRGLPAEELFEKAKNFGLEGEVAGSVNEALRLARKTAGDTDMIFVGGSTFVVADIEEL